MNNYYDDEYIPFAEHAELTDEDYYAYDICHNVCGAYDDYYTTDENGDIVPACSVCRYGKYGEVLRGE